MNRKIHVPPIKSQGIKTKLVPWIRSVAPDDIRGTWVEPFAGTGVVAFNIAPKKAFLCDMNPHLVRFYQSITDGRVTPGKAREFLIVEGEKLLRRGEDYYYFVRDRFNAEHSPLDFLFLNRAGFNGMIRFNKKGEFNVPFCRKPHRFTQSYITKIVNQIAFIQYRIEVGEFEFRMQDFQKTIAEAGSEDLIYCDPPYIARHVDYHNGWEHKQEVELFTALSKFRGRFILSTWHHNDYRENNYVRDLWSQFNLVTREHFYHLGGREENRNPVVEALVTNFPVNENAVPKHTSKVRAVNQTATQDGSMQQAFW